ncbi:MAG: hypothetical protein LBF22_06120 [Deltaproteobacteria bacterium]|nr:hypothetical protein [Deltaproteobacteria bacterium]
MRTICFPTALSTPSCGNLSYVRGHAHVHAFCANLTVIFTLLIRRLQGRTEILF